MKQVFDDSESPAAEGATTPSPAVAARGPAADKLRPVASGQRGRPDTGPPKPPQRGRFWPPRVNVRVHTFDSLRYREFRLLWLGSLSSSGSLWVQQLIVGWLTYDLTRSPLITSLALGLGALPFPPGAPIGGVLADIWDRRKLLMAAWATQAAITAGFSVVVLLDRVETWHIFAYVLAMGCAWAVSDPAWFAMVPSAVPRRGLINAMALGGLGHNAMQFAAPAAAGLIIALRGPGPALVAGAVMYFGASLAAVAMIPSAPARDEARTREPLRRFWEGVRYVADERLVLGLVLIAAVPLLLLPPFVHGLMPVYASEVFRVGPAGLGLLMSAIGIGSTLSSIVMASLGDLRYKGRAIAIAMALLVAATVAFSRMPATAPAVPMLIVLSGALAVLRTVPGACIMAVVPEELRGRVSSLWTLIAGLFPLGSLLGGGLAELLGAPSATLVGAAVLAVVCAGLLLKFKQVRAFQQ